MDATITVAVFVGVAVGAVVGTLVAVFTGPDTEVGTAPKPDSTSTYPRMVRALDAEMLCEPIGSNFIHGV